MVAEIDSDGSGTVDFDGKFVIQSHSWNHYVCAKPTKSFFNTHKKPTTKHLSLDL